MTRLLTPALLFLAACTSAFAPQPISATRRQHPSQLSEAAALQDGKGNVLTEGSIVRVCKEGLTAFHVKKSGFGTFNDDKQFVASEDTEERTSKALAIPVGLRGVVTRVYDTKAISSNFPVTVKFMPGEHAEEEGYDSPVSFNMHFGATEVEVV